MRDRSPRHVRSRLGALVRHWGQALLQPIPLIGFVRVPGYLVDLARYQRLSAPGNRVALSDTHPCLADATGHTPFDPHYFFQGAWLARELARARPDRHVDVGSSVVMLSVLSATVPTTFVDYRPLRVTLPGLQCIAGSVLCLPFADASIRSLSSLHVIEHVGLGRYGDPLDPAGTIRAARELARVVAPGGRLYVSLPVGRERVCFNAHRVLAPGSVEAAFTPLRLLDFAFVDDAGRMLTHARPSAAADCNYGCGMFVFERTAS